LLFCDQHLEMLNTRYLRFSKRHPTAASVAGCTVGVRFASTAKSADATAIRPFHLEISSPLSWSSPPGRRRSATPCNLTRHNTLDNITLYWLTGTGASAPRWFWESGRAQAAAAAAGQAPSAVSVPVGFTTFPGELWAAPRNWVESVYPGLTYFNEVDRGGHFAAWEEPEVFSTEVRAAFRSLR